MNNNLEALNNYLFAQMERLDDESLTDAQLINEIRRAKAITEVSNAIVNNGSLILQAMKFNDNKIDIDMQMPALLEVNRK